MVVFAVGSAAGAAIFLWLRPGAREIPLPERATRAIVELVRARHPEGTELTEAEIRKALAAGRVVAGDPDSRVLAEETARELLEPAAASGGIGIAIERSGDGLIVLSVLPGCPAGEAGIAPGDRLASIEGIPTEGLSLEAAAARLRGEVGTGVKVAYWQAAAGILRERTLRRASCDIPACRAERLPEGPVLVRIDRFVPDLGMALRDAVAGIADGPGPSGILLDLRDLGGEPRSAAEAASPFLPQGTVLATLRGPGSGAGEPLATGGAGPWRDTPLAVLVNGRTASAAEILAGSFQALGRARLAGRTTFGKRTAQGRFPIPGGILLLTVGRYDFPGREGGPGGVVPDLVVKTETEEAYRSAGLALLAL